MSVREVKLTLKKHKNSTVFFRNLLLFKYKFERNEVFKSLWCQNYTIGNFTIMKPISGNVPGN